MTDYITTDEAAKVLHYGRRHIIKLYHAGRLQGRFYGRQLVIEQASGAAYQAEDAREAGLVPVEAAQPYRRGRL